MSSTKHLSHPIFLIATITSTILLLLLYPPTCDAIHHFTHPHKPGSFTSIGIQSATIQRGNVCTQQNTQDCYDAWIVTGKVDYKMTNAFANKVNRFGTKIPFCLLSNGGNLQAAKDIINIIRQSNAKVCLGSTYSVNGKTLWEYYKDINGNIIKGPLCMSACSIIFASAKQRLIFGNAFIGIHNTRHILDFCFCQLTVSKPEQSYQPKTYQALIFELKDIDDKKRIRKLRDYSEQVSSDSMKFLSIKEMTELSLPTKIISPKQ